MVMPPRKITYSELLHSLNTRLNFEPYPLNPHHHEKSSKQQIAGAKRYKK
jgi:hypothetical protein